MYKYNHFLLGLCPSLKNEWNKENYFPEMKGDVGMSHHERKGKKMPTQNRKSFNPTPTSLFLFVSQLCMYFGS